LGAAEPSVGGFAEGGADVVRELALGVGELLAAGGVVARGGGLHGEAGVEGALEGEDAAVLLLGLEALAVAGAYNGGRGREAEIVGDLFLRRKKRSEVAFALNGEQAEAFLVRGQHDAAGAEAGAEFRVVLIDAPEGGPLLRGQEVEPRAGEPGIVPEGFAEDPAELAAQLFAGLGRGRVIAPPAFPDRGPGALEEGGKAPAEEQVPRGGWVEAGGFEVAGLAGG
jgi:hypothetical protein